MPRSSVVRLTLVCLTLFCLLATGAFAQEQTPANPPAVTAVPVPQPPLQPVAAAKPSGSVVEYARVRNARSHTFTASAGLGDRMIVEVENFPKLLADAGGNCAGIVLFLDTLPMNGLPPQSCDVQDGTVRFLLMRNEKNEEQWHWLLGRPSGFTRKVRVSVGPTNMIALPTLIQDFPLRILPARMFYLWLAVTLVGLLVYLYLCRNTALIRGARASATTPTALRPYSLSRFQMAFWFFLVIAAYVFMWLILGELDTITESILALMGIGAGTALGSAFIDSSANSSSAEKTGAVADANAVSRGFLRDVLDDGSGISFHRFQMFVWTLILGFIFVGSVYKGLAMPQFSATLLGLMGVSSGTYLGFKFPEKTNRESAQTATGAPPPPSAQP